MPELRDMLEPDVLAGLRSYIGDEAERESLPKAVNVILRDWLTSQGHIPYQELPEGEDDPDG